MRRLLTLALMSFGESNQVESVDKKGRIPWIFLDRGARLQSYGLVSYKDSYQLPLLNYHLTFGPSDVCKNNFPTHCHENHERLKNPLDSTYPFVRVREVAACGLSWQQPKSHQFLPHGRWVVCPVAETASLTTLCCNPSTSQAPKASHSRKPQQV